ncbi:MAG: DUF222 domain-containing protein [Acidimicrobiales bacterium]
MAHTTESEAAASRLETEIAEVCGFLNATAGRLVALIAEVLATGAWEGWRIRSPEHWVAWKCGVSPGRARSLVAMARRLGELPETKKAFEAGEVTEDQVAVVCRHIPASVDGEAAELARVATVPQLRRALGGYTFEAQPSADDDGGPQPPPEEPRRMAFGYTDTGSWQLSALLPADEGALVERALTEARNALVKAGDKDASWADALIAVAERSLGSQGAGRGTTVLLHLDVHGSHLHLGPTVPEGVRDYLACDSRVRHVWDDGGKPVSVGRASRTVPDRTRIVVEERDRGCRVPGCSRTRWLHVHHIDPWHTGGRTDTSNLLALCSKHHRLLHLGHLRIQGDADEPDGVVFSDHRGRPLADAGCPAPPTRPPDETATDLGIPRPRWTHPPGEFLDPACIWFPEGGSDAA